jgi:hypothetical protein
VGRFEYVTDSKLQFIGVAIENTSSVGYAATFPSRGRLGLSAAHPSITAVKSFSRLRNCFTLRFA